MTVFNNVVALVQDTKMSAICSVTSVLLPLVR